MSMIAFRLAATRVRDADLAYPNADELLADLRVLQDSLVAAGDERRAYAQVQDLIWQVETFGFHLAEFEVRQPSEVHRRTLAELDAQAAGELEELSPMSVEVLDTFRAIAAIQRRHGEKALRRYIISFATSAQDVSDVYRLAEAAFGDRKSTRLNSSHVAISYAVFCLKKKTKPRQPSTQGTTRRTRRRRQ